MFHIDVIIQRKIGFMPVCTQKIGCFSKFIFPENIRNFRFEADITDNELTFSYRLRPGVAQNMNACFLMKKMGIAVTD